MKKLFNKTVIIATFFILNIIILTPMYGCESPSQLKPIDIDHYKKILGLLDPKPEDKITTVPQLIQQLSTTKNSLVVANVITNILGILHVVGPEKFDTAFHGLEAATGAPFTWLLKAACENGSIAATENITTRAFLYGLASNLKQEQSTEKPINLPRNDNNGLSISGSTMLGNAASTTLKLIPLERQKKFYNKQQFSTPLFMLLGNLLHHHPDTLTAITGNINYSGILTALQNLDSPGILQQYTSILTSIKDNPQAIYHFGLLIGLISEGIQKGMTTTYKDLLAVQQNNFTGNDDAMTAINGQINEINKEVSSSTKKATLQEAVDTTSCSSTACNQVVSEDDLKGTINSIINPIETLQKDVAKQKKNLFRQLYLKGASFSAGMIGSFYLECTNHGQRFLELQARGELQRKIALAQKNNPELLKNDVSNSLVITEEAIKEQVEICRKRLIAYLHAAPPIVYAAYQTMRLLWMPELP